IFNPLELTHILGIARLQIKELLQRDGFVRRTTILNISKEALEWVAQRGFDARMGGRALKRQIERDLTALSAEQLISTQIDTPILFDILLKSGKLTPRIRPLQFVQPAEDDWLPDL
ncbi:MAG: ATP-dependent Clp protease ATP-binding subunit, partial [Phaeodactylibacter sp.]|nr:ATP-dependent Clp protease ATP-binding subunit [Phaeodactylibacter sp.]